MRSKGRFICGIYGKNISLMVVIVFQGYILNMIVGESDVVMGSGVNQIGTGWGILWSWNIVRNIECI